MFDEMDLDILREIGNIGSGNAATALSEMVGETVDIGVPNCKLIPYSEMADVLSGSENVIMGVLVQLEGDLEGFIMMAQNLPDAQKMLKTLMQMDVNVSEEDIEGSLEQLEPLLEIVNIVSGSYLSAISSMTGLTIYPDIPRMTIDMAMAIMNVPALVYGEVGDSVLMLETSFFTLKDKLDGHFFLMPTVESFAKLRKALLGE